MVGRPLLWGSLEFSNFQFTRFDIILVQTLFSCHLRVPSSQWAFDRNKFCFTGGYIETAAQLPGRNNVVGMWPAVWTMGNLGRAGYGASLDVMVRVFLK